MQISFLHSVDSLPCRCFVLVENLVVINISDSWGMSISRLNIEGVSEK